MLPYLTYGYWHTPYFFYTAIQDLVCTLLALWLTMMLWSFGRMVFWLYRFLLRGLFFFMILVTLISRSPCCSSSKSGSQARQECKSWYVTYIFDLVSLKAVILSTWFLSSGYSFVSNAIPLIFEITLESLCNHDKNGSPVFFAYALVLPVWCSQMLRRVFCCPKKKLGDYIIFLKITDNNFSLCSFSRLAFNSLVSLSYLGISRSQNDL